MIKETYKNQVNLLLTVLPEVAKESCFALHGGTAINLFVRDMPRLSVDIDLTYVPIEDRETSFGQISGALEAITQRLETIHKFKVNYQKEISKLQVSNQKAQIKLEVSQVNRGTLAEPVKMILCAKAQQEFQAFCTIPVVPIYQLFGGKICAALDRQHPRDLFDAKYLLANIGITNEVKKGLFLCLLASNRPIHEVLYPNFLDQHTTLANQFDGMSIEKFQYDDFEDTRKRLVGQIHASLNETDKAFLLSFKNAEPDWGIYDFEKFPAIQWKLQNLKKLKDQNPLKHQELLAALKEKLNRA